MNSLLHCFYIGFRFLPARQLTIQCSTTDTRGPNAIKIRRIHHCSTKLVYFLPTAGNVKIHILRTTRMLHSIPECRNTFVWFHRLWMCSRTADRVLVMVEQASTSSRATISNHVPQNHVLHATQFLKLTPYTAHMGGHSCQHYRGCDITSTYTFG